MLMLISIGMMGYDEAAGSHGDTGNAVSTTRDSSMQFWIETDAN
jgi:hypothetical protein